MIKLTEKYYLSCDRYNWILHEKVLKDPDHHFTKDTLNPYNYQIVGFYETIKGIYKRLLDENIRFADSLEVIIEIVERFEAKVDDLFVNFSKEDLKNKGQLLEIKNFN